MKPDSCESGFVYYRLKSAGHCGLLMLVKSLMDVVNHNPPSRPASAETKVTIRKRTRRTWFGFYRDLLIYLMIYVAVSGVSIGPLFWVWFGAVYADGPKWIARFYHPLLLLCELFPPLDWLINLWVNWWIH